MEISQGREKEKTDCIGDVKATLDRIFSGRCFRRAHLEARPVLTAMAADPNVLRAVFSAAVASPGFLLNKRINPVLALPVVTTERFTLVANCWIPRPDGDTGISHQSIHHHGNLLLTSVGAYGPGYETILFAKGYSCSADRANLKVDKIYHNTLGHIEFVDSYAPHVVFYPKHFSVTYALWSREAPVFGANVASSSFLRRYKKPLKKVMHAFGLGRMLGVNQEGDLDFYVSEGRFVRLSKRVQYAPGTNANFLQALHYIAREIEVVDERILAAIAHAQGDPAWQNEFEPNHLFVPKVNLSRREILACLN